MRYEAPETLEAALALLASGDARILAGGTDLIVQMRAGRAEPALRRRRTMRASERPRRGRR